MVMQTNQFGQTVNIRGFVIVVSLRGFEHPCQLFMARDASKSTRMTFGCFIMRRCDELSSDLKLDLLSAL